MAFIRSIFDVANGARVGARRIHLEAIVRTLRAVQPSRGYQ